AEYGGWTDPYYDLGSALSRGGVGLAEIKRVDLYSIAYHGTKWSPGGGAGTELELVLLAGMVDGRWVAAEAWNDYTGWGCRDNSDVHIAATRDQAIANGLTNSGRLALGLPEVSR